jgi:competence protein ComEC
MAVMCLLGWWLLSRRQQPGGFLALLLAWALTGSALSGWRVDPGEVPSALEDGTEAVLEGTVEASSANSVRLAVDGWSLQPGEPLSPTRFRSLLSGLPSEILPGERLRVLAKLFRSRPPQNPGEPDRVERDVQGGVSRHGVVRSGEWLRLASASFWERWSETARANFLRTAEVEIADARSRALVETLAVGERSGLDAETNEHFNSSGLAHILSVSGLHIAVVALGLLRLLRALLSRSERLLLRFEAAQLAGLLAIPALWAYVLLTGAEVPAVRSGIMATVLIGARTFRREPEGFSSLAWALIAVLSYDPASLHDVSFQLSFMAVLGLMALARPLRELVPVAQPDPSQTGWRRTFERAREALVSGMCTSLAASLATGPLVARVFHRESLVSVLANLVALPVASALTAVAASAAALSSCLPALRLLLHLAAPLAKALIAVADGFGGLSFAQVRVAAPEPTTVLAYYFGLATLPFWAKSTWARRVGVTSVSMLTLLGVWRTAQPRLEGDLTVTFLSVGQGDSTFVRLPGGTTLLIDGGGEVGSHTNPGVQVLAPFLWDQGIDVLDVVALSHPHPDHALGLIGLGPLVPAKELWLADGPDANTKPGSSGLVGELLAAFRAGEHGGAIRRELKAGDVPLEQGHVRIEVLGPPKGATFAKVNDQSLVLKLSYGEVSFLFPGDAEAEAEAALLASGRDLSATVLKAPHHGSSTSSSEEFVRAVHPHAVVFCVGAHNRFGFPVPSVVERYQQQGCQLFRTDRDGAVTFRTDGHDAWAETFLAPGWVRL